MARTPILDKHKGIETCGKTIPGLSWRLIAQGRNLGQDTRSSFCISLDRCQLRRDKKAWLFSLAYNHRYLHADKEYLEVTVSKTKQPAHGYWSLQNSGL